MSDNKTKASTRESTTAPSPNQETNRSSANDLNFDTEMDTQPTDIKKEIWGRKGPEPTRYGDWESKGRCIDF